MKDPAVAWFASRGRRRETDLVKSAVVSLLGYIHGPTDAELFQDDHDSFVRRGLGRSTRLELFGAPAMAGEIIPPAIRCRLDAVFNGLPLFPTSADPVTPPPNPHRNTLPPPNSANRG